MKYSKALIRQIRYDLLSHTTDAEKATPLQPIVSGRKLFLADIYWPEIKTIIECDGAYHFTKDQKRKDGNRSSGIWRLGYHVIRLSNHDARNPKKVKAKIDMIQRKAK